MKARSALLSLVLVLALPALAGDVPRNVILLVGDGIGPAHVSYMRLLRGEAFQLRRMAVAGLLTTSAADRTVTDSGAAATALATGFKTRYEAVGVDAEGRALRTVLEAAEESGKATGLVTTAAFWDATPAAFAAHAGHRTQYLDIIRQMLRSGAEIIAGSGAQRFGRDGFPPLEDLARENGYELIRTRGELDAARGPKMFAVFPDVPRERDAAEASLAELTRWALAHLSKDSDGFFLMVEHEGVDSGSHQNSREDVAESLRSFDAAIGVALDFAAGRGDTLVVVTSDHETGGMRITETAARRPRIEFATIDHTATNVLLFTFGPGGESLRGFLDNTDVGKTLLSFVGRKQSK
ncbi:MAG TPA: alkaline phosphatase [Thermoanaerobaculia bacterium]|nr:alkaline phosphatase [Thermoanaerobaculia bacterium]